MMKLNEYKEYKIESNSFIIIINLYMILICIRCSFSCYESVFIKKQNIFQFNKNQKKKEIKLHI